MHRELKTRGWLGVRGKRATATILVVKTAIHDVSVSQRRPSFLLRKPPPSGRRLSSPFVSVVAIAVVVVVRWARRSRSGNVVVAVATFAAVIIVVTVIVAIGGGGSGDIDVVVVAAVDVVASWSSSRCP